MTRRGFFGLAAAGASAALAQDASTITQVTKAGFVEADITPEIGMEQPGGYSKVFHRSFHDPCKVRVAVVDDGRKRVALVGLDALVVPRQLVQAVRKEIRSRCGLAAESVLIGASHSHSSGPTGMIQPGEYDDASPLVKKLAYEQSSCADARYLEKVHQQIVAAVCEADRTRAEVRLSVGSGQESHVGFNRRFRMKNGRTFTHPGQGNPDIREPAGPIDPAVGVVGSWDATGQLTGCIVNYACHATTSPGGISANWIYYMEKTIRGTFGDRVPVVFLQGACGDITQVDNLSPYQPPAAEEGARLVGGRVGAEAIKVLLSSPRGALTPVDFAARQLNIRRRAPDSRRVEHCLAMVQKDPKEVGVTDWVFAKEIVLLDASLKGRPVADVEVQAVQIGPAIFITNPAELFVELGLELKRRSPFRFTFPVELANGCVGYVPTEEALSPTGGGYETRLTSYSNLEPTAGRQMVQAGLELARAMKPGPIPEPPKAAPFREPWPYGNVPPELQ
jgi:neutral ceramidase